MTDPHTTPTNLRELVLYLAEHPHVFMSCPNPLISGMGPQRFTGAADGRIWFESRDGQRSHLPIDCGLTPAESGVEFDPDGFRVTKFGVTITIKYLGDDKL